MTAAVENMLPWATRARATAERTWNRLDRMLLRLQGRVDTPTWDRWLPWGFAGLLAAVLIVAVLARHHSLLLGAETAKYAQVTWQIAEGWRPETTLSGGNAVAEQGSLILYPLALITAVLPRTETLLILKAVALALTIVPLWRLARRHARLGIGVSSAVVFAYAIYMAVHRMNAADFAPAVLALPALMWAVLLGFEGKYRLIIVAVVFALCCRADLGLAVAGLGILLLIEGERRVGTVATLLGVGWFLVSIYGLQPALNDGSYSFLEPYAAFGETPLRALWGIISSPLRFLDTVFTFENFLVLVALLAPVLFLPLTAPRHLLPAVPLYMLYMGADVEPGQLRESAQTVPITVFIFVATVFALQRSGRTLVKRVRVDRRIVLALLLTSLVFFLKDSPTSPYQAPWEWGTRDGADASRLEAIALLPDEQVPVRASASLLPLLSERLGIFELDTGGDRELDDVVGDAVDRVDWLFYDLTAENLSSDEVDTFRSRVLAVGGWQRVESTIADPTMDVYQFTGIIAPEPVPIPSPLDDTGPGGG